MSGFGGLKYDKCNPVRFSENVIPRALATMPPDLKAQFMAQYTEMYNDVLAEHGHAAAEMPKFHAAIHEAGHCVMEKAEGGDCVSAHIYKRTWSMRGTTFTVWGGNTDAAGALLEYGPGVPENNLRLARRMFAGVAAERLFAKPFHEASAIDELVAAQLFISFAAQDLNRPPQELWGEMIENVMHTLANNQDVLHEIAEALKAWTPRALEGEHLQKHLRCVKEKGPTD